MQLEAGVAILRRWPLVLLLLAPAFATADSKLAPFELDAIAFKENGRFQEKIVAECAIEQELREAATTLSRKLQRKQSQNPAADGGLRHVRLRIDNVGNLGSSGRVGTELGVTAILAGKDTGQLFLCRDNSLLTRPTHCERVSHCARKIVEDVASWVGAQKTG